MYSPITGSRKTIVTGSLILAAMMSSTLAYATGDQGNQNGMPFRNLQEQIDILSLDLSEAIAVLQGQIDQLVLDQTDQDSLIAALQSAVATLDVRVSGTEFEIAALQAMQDLQGQLINALEINVVDLDTRVSANTGDIAALVLVDQALQDLIEAIQSQISIINARIDNNDGDIATLQNEVALLENGLASAQSQLAGKQDRVDGICAPGSSIREIFPDGNVTCEADTVSSGTGTLQTYRSSDSVSIPSSVIFTRTASNSRSCTGSYRAVGGGYYLSGHLGVGNVYRNRPTSNFTWNATVRSDSTGSRTLTTYVVCARVN